MITFIVIVGLLIKSTYFLLDYLICIKKIWRMYKMSYSKVYGKDSCLTNNKFYVMF